VEDSENPGSQPVADQQPGEKKPPRRRAFLVVLVLIAAAFAGGLILGLRQSQGAREEWRRQKSDLEGSTAGLSRDLQSERGRAFLWQVAEGIAEVRVNLAEKNFGLARDAAAAVEQVFAAAPADLSPETRSRLAPLGPLLTQIKAAADSVSPEARSRALEASNLLRLTLEPASPAADAGGSTAREGATGSP